MDNDRNKANEIPNSSSDRSSFLSSLFRRSFSLQEPQVYDENEFVVDRITNRSRSRGFSESSLDDFDTNDDGTFVPKSITRRRSATEVDGGNMSSIQGSSRPRSLTLSAMLLGNRLPVATEETTSDLFSSVNKEDNSNLSQENSASDASDITRETSQTDHLNKKLLGSFLTRINSVAANIIDPSGRGENIGQVYTDDVMMDRILRRVESDKK